ncbi:hypothetical protein TRICI_006105 [Trichomonascus ciferrii]|uniref:Anaphase-promoting complex subunit 4 WD40 domain-containing protein n=1 Tax=Trichomonascus ciferrii TaxID=44093 RepID=A0A642ULC3_9ASCO|nr:hypothetical protein TRICI_006105 [Trichomonascus ciferrii]
MQGLDLSRDQQLTDAQNDSISDMAFYRKQSSMEPAFLSVAAWDGSVVVYEVNEAENVASRVAGYTHNGPVLSTHWHPERPIVVSSGCDNRALAHDLASNCEIVLGSHNEVISSIRVLDDYRVATASWDQSIRIWDIRMDNRNPSATVKLSGRVYSLDHSGNVDDKWLVTCDSTRTVSLIDCQKGVMMGVVSPLKCHTRRVAVAPTGGWAVVSGTEGICAVVKMSQRGDIEKDFSFLCHRAPRKDSISILDIYPVNTVAFHPKTTTFCTGGSDGHLNTWDKVKRRKISTSYPMMNAPITASAFSPSGNTLAYSVSYDWSKGHSFNTPESKSSVCLHQVVQSDVRIP